MHTRSCNMKIARIAFEEQTHYAIVDNEHFTFIQDDIFTAITPTKETCSLEQATILPPVIPSKIIALAVNYESHAKGHNMEAFPVPEPFFKTTSSIIGHKDDVILPQNVGRVDAEAEVVVVIGKQASKITAEQVTDHIFGYTCGNDISARDWQKNDNQWWRAKSADTFAPIGPYITTGLDPNNINIIGRINNKIIQESNTSHLIHSIEKSISFISQFITLHPGDLIFTGTPGTTQAIKAGDILEVEVPEIGTLSNTVS